MTGQVICTTDGDARTSGCVTFWRLSGSIDITRLVEAWDEKNWNGDLLPSTPSEHVALRRAVAELYHQRGVLVRPVRGEHATAVLDLTHIDDGGEKLKPTYTTRFVVWIDEAGVPQSEPALGLLERQALFAKFTDVSQRVDEELSGWFAKVVFALGGVALRDSGGVYYVPDGCDSHFMRWEDFAALIEKISACRLYRIPAMDTESATRAILDSLQDEIVKATTQMTEALDAKTFGKKALASRVDKLQTMIKKVSQYESMFDSSLEDLRTGLDELSVRITEALLVAEEEA